MKKIIFLLLVLLFFNCEQKKTASADAKQDSIQKYLNLAANESLVFDKRVEYNDKAYSLLNLKENDSLTRTYIYQISKNYSTLSKLAENKSKIETLIELSLKANDSLMLAKSYNIKANYFIDKNELDSSYVNFFKAEKIFIKLQDSINLGNNYLEKGFVQISIGDYIGCEQSSSLYLRYLGNRGFYNREYYAYNYIGICSNYLENYDNAILYHKKAYEIAKKNKFSDKFHYQSVSLNNIGVVYQQLKNHEEAISNFTLALKDKNLLTDNPDLYVKLIDNLAYSKFKLNDNKNIPALFYKSLKTSKDLKLNPVISSYSHLTEYYLSIKDTLQSINFAKIALKESKRQKARGELLFSLQQLSFIDKKNSSKYSREYIKINDSLQVAERKSKDQLARIQLETDEITKEKDQAIQGKWKITISSIVIIVILILIIIIFRQRTKQKELELSQSQQKANEEIYQLMLTQKNSNEMAKEEEKKRIAKELHDGVMNKLASTRLNLSIINQKTDSQTITKRLNQISDIYNIEQEIRNIAHDLNTDVFKEENTFISMLKELIENQNQNSSTLFSLELDQQINWNTISSKIKMNLFRIIQEAIHNINKHAHADKAVIAFLLDDNNLCLSISDNGIGFNPQKTNQNGIGIKNMNARIKSLNGKITINSYQKNKTSINISIPI